jgi:hypothetical protein
MKRREFPGVLTGVAAARVQRSVTVAAALTAAVIFALSSTTGDAETPGVQLGLVKCGAWLSSPASARDGENWIHGFWDGLVQGLGYVNRVGQIPYPDVMLDDVRKTCKDRPSSTLAESAFLTFERMRQGAFTPLTEK